MKPFILLIALAIIGANRTLAAEPSFTFEESARPILKAYCFECHGEGESLKGELDLRLKRFIEKGGKSGSAISTAKPQASLILEKVRSGEMPPGKKKLSPVEIKELEKWIMAGARTQGAEPEKLESGFHLTGADKSWWAFQPIVRPEAPKIGSSRIRVPIDAFILKKLQENKLDFSPDADRRTLIRRLSFDLTGLPPTPDEVDAFEKDTSTDAYEKLIDRLLASQAYGEHWGRHWLDVAGYADSEGVSVEDPIRTNAWRYRDYVIRSFNADKPFDRFIVEQLAGDELLKPPYRDLMPEDIEKLEATGFLRTAADGSASPNADQKMSRLLVVSDTIKIISTSFLGLTVGCAQCHNHRYDPIPQTDYYRLWAILGPAYDIKNWRAPALRQVSLATDTDRATAKEIDAQAAKIDAERIKKQNEYIEATFEKELAKLSEDMRPKAKEARNTPDAKRSAEQKKIMRENPSLNVSAGSLYLYDKKAADELTKMTTEAAALRAKKPVEEFIRAMTEPVGPVSDTFLFNRGDPDQPKQAIAPGGLTILDEKLPLKIQKSAELPTSGRRSSFARWLTSRDQPLTARVLVNRVWLNHFGRGIVNSPGEFGRLGELPTHPELLDWLASVFMENGWSMKKLHRQILLSTTYRQTSKRDAVNDAIDPDNKLLHRMNLRRLEAESVRDAILSVSGKLNSKQFGPPVPVRENEVGQIVVGKGTKDLARGTVKEDPLPDGEINRRSVYVQVRRSMPVGVLETFDAPSLEPNCEFRRVSTATPQSLLLLNSEFIQDQSTKLAERVKKDAGSDAKEQAARAWKLAYGTDASEADLLAATMLIKAQEEHFKKVKSTTDPATRALAVYCQALLSSNRFLYVD